MSNPGKLHDVLVERFAVGADNPSGIQRLAAAAVEDGAGIGGDLFFALIKIGKHVDTNKTNIEATRRLQRSELVVGISVILGGILRCTPDVSTCSANSCPCSLLWSVA